MNRIEEEWLHLKRYDDEYDLAIALMETIEECGQRPGYPIERFRFNFG